MQQVFVKDPNKTIEQLQKEAIAASDENISIRRFARFQLRLKELREGSEPTGRETRWLFREAK